MAIASIDQNGNVVASATNATKYSTASKSTSDNSSLDKEAFLQLLVAQMQNQDPLDPQDNSEMVAQMATFSQVEQMQNMSHTMSQSQGFELIGKVVQMKYQSASGEDGTVTGYVDYVLKENDKVYLGIKGNEYDLEDLITVIDKDVLSE